MASCCAGGPEAAQPRYGRAEALPKSLNKEQCGTPRAHSLVTHTKVTAVGREHQGNSAGQQSSLGSRDHQGDRGHAQHPWKSKEDSSRLPSRLAQSLLFLGWLSAKAEQRLQNFIMEASKPCAPPLQVPT